jgi:hypothetical protein
MDERIVILLEEIAFRLSHCIKEKDVYLKELYASHKREAAPVHGGRVGPETSRQEDPNRDERKPVERVRAQEHQEKRTQTQNDRGLLNWTKKIRT